MKQKTFHPQCISKAIMTSTSLYKRFLKIGKTEVMKIDQYFAKKEICVYQFWENLEKITSQSLMRNKLQIKAISRRRLNSFLEKVHLQINQCHWKEDNSLISNIEKVATKLNSFFSHLMQKISIFQTMKTMVLCQRILIILLWRLLLNHSCIFAIALEHKHTGNFSFSFV